MGFLSRLFGKGKKKTDEPVFYGAYDEGLKDEPFDEGLKDEPFEACSENVGKGAAEKKDSKSKRATRRSNATNNKEEVKEKCELKDTSLPEVKENKKTPRAASTSERKPVKKNVNKESSAMEKKPDAVMSEAKDNEVKAGARTARSGRFDIKRSKDGRYVFNLYASNHVIIATSQTYSSSTAAQNGIKSVIANAPTAPIEDRTLKKHETLTYPKWELYQDKGGQYRFRLCASNGSCVCHSQGYTAKSNCKGGIESIIKFAKDAEIDKSYLKKD